MSKARKKSGFPLDWSDPAGVAQRKLLLLALAPLSRRLGEARPATAPYLSETVLAKLIFEFQVFMEMNLGRDSAKPQHKVKFPASLFKDFRENGSLYLILDSLVEHLWPQLSFDGRDAARAPQLWTAFEASRTALATNGFLPGRRVFFGDSVPSSEVVALTAIVVSHDAEVVANRDEATVIVEWDSNVDGVAAAESSDDYVRTLDIRRAFDGNGAVEGAGSQALVHWWYHPDSYDEWIPATDVDNNEMPELIPDSSAGPPGSSVWTVCCRYIRDLDLFNEWGNEVDYEVDLIDSALKATSVDEKTVGTRMKTSKGRGKRKLSSSGSGDVASGGSSRRQVQYAPVMESSGATDKAMNDVPPPSCSSSRNPPGADAASYSLLSVSSVDDVSGSSCKLSTESAAPVWGAAAPSATRSELGEADVKRPRFGGAYSLPSTNVHSDGKVTGVSAASSSGHMLRLSAAAPSWFKADSVSSVELRYLPEFFDASSRIRSPAVYLSIRSYICNLYAQNTSIYLSATDCRRKIAGDAGSIMRIHNFLDSFGVINHAVPAEARPPMSPMAASLTPLGGPAALPVHRADDGFLGVSSGARCKWDETADAALAAAVLRHGDDWAAVARDLATSTKAGEKSIGITAEDCIIRFAQLPLQSGSEEAISSSAASSMEVEGGSRAEEAHPAYQSIQKLLNEYIGARLAAVEEKVKLLASAEAVLTAEQRRLDLERRDLQVQRAQFSYAQQQSQLGGMAALP